MPPLVESLARSFYEVETESESFDALVASVYSMLDPQVCLLVREDDDQFVPVASRSSDDTAPPSSLSRLSVPGLCHAADESCLIDDHAATRSGDPKSLEGDSALTDCRSLVVVPLSDTDLVVTGTDEPGAYTQADLELVETAVAFASTYLQEIASSSPDRDRKFEQLASVLSHDAGNMVGIIEASLELHRAGTDGTEFDRIRRALGRLEDLIDDVASMLRTEHADFETETVDLTRVVSTAWEIVGAEGTDLVVGDLGLVSADESKLCQVFENLLGNAVSHTDQGSVVWVGRFADGIYIADTGDGIAPDERETVFDPGYSTETGDTGFGLSIVEWIVTAHGWDITAHESNFGGARFEISGLSFVDAENEAERP